MHSDPTPSRTTAHGVLAAALAACGITATSCHPTPAPAVTTYRDAGRGERAALVRLPSGASAWGFGPSDAAAAEHAAHNARAVVADDIERDLQDRQRTALRRLPEFRDAPQLSMAERYGITA